MYYVLCTVRISSMLRITCTYVYLYLYNSYTFSALYTIIVRSGVFLCVAHPDCCSAGKSKCSFSPRSTSWMADLSWQLTTLSHIWTWLSRNPGIERYGDNLRMHSSPSIISRNSSLLSAIAGVEGVFSSHSMEGERDENPMMEDLLSYRVSTVFTLNYIS